MIFTRLMDMPTTVKGFVTEDENGDFNIYINPRLSDAEQKRVYKHELFHIQDGHFSCNTAEEAESRNIYR